MKTIYQDDSDTPLAVCDESAFNKPMIMKLWGKDGDVNKAVWKVDNELFDTELEARNYRKSL